MKYFLLSQPAPVQGKKTTTLLSAGYVEQIDFWWLCKIRSALRKVYVIMRIGGHLDAGESVFASFLSQCIFRLTNPPVGVRPGSADVVFVLRAALSERAGLE